MTSSCDELSNYFFSRVSISETYMILGYKVGPVKCLLVYKRYSYIMLHPL